jgi:uncharacterized protein YbbK (DUF523 family)
MVPFILVPDTFLRYNTNGSKGGIWMEILVSACLLGVPCRYDAKSGEDARVIALAGRHTLIPVCPEIYGGLPTPRTPCEIRDGRVYQKTGEDVTGEYTNGAQAARLFARVAGCRYAVLKERSPSCGTGRIYDGSFSGKLVPGDGVTAALLKKDGIIVLTPDQLDMIR